MKQISFERTTLLSKKTYEQQTKALDDFWCHVDKETQIEKFDKERKKGTLPIAPHSIFFNESRECAKFGESFRLNRLS